MLFAGRGSEGPRVFPGTRHLGRKWDTVPEHMRVTGHVEVHAVPCARNVTPVPRPQDIKGRSSGKPWRRMYEAASHCSAPVWAHLRAVLRMRGHQCSIREGVSVDASLTKQRQGLKTRKEREPSTRRPSGDRRPCVHLENVHVAQNVGCNTLAMDNTEQRS